MRWRWKLPRFWGHLPDAYLPGTLSRWTVLAINNTGHFRHFADDGLLGNYILAAIGRVLKGFGGVDGAGGVNGGGGGGILSVVSENISGTFLNDATAPEGVCKSPCQV